MPPGYWMHETSGVLRPAIMAYLNREPLTQEYVGTLRAYFRQWINDPAWLGPGIAELRIAVDHIASREDIADWLDVAENLGVDPL